VHAYSIRAETYLALNESQKAVQDFKKSIELSPLNISRYEGCCNILIKNSKFEECIEVLNKAIEVELSHPFINERLGFCYFSIKDYIKAQKFLKEAIRLEPENVSFLNALAICYRDARDFEKSLQVYNQILKKDAENYHVLFNKAILFLLMDRHDEALRLLRRTLKIEPTFKKAIDKLNELGASLEEES
jgi:tetratricopeptide (TPR) repeat protein